MEETFELPVLFEEEERFFRAKLLHIGYTHKFMIEVNGHEIIFEPDEERNYRAVVDSSFLERDTRIDVKLLKAVAEAIETIVK